VQAEPEEVLRRMAAMRAHIREYDIQAWSSSYLTALLESAG
jgi:trehalose 6-phosphate synthase